MNNVASPSPAATTKLHNPTRIPNICGKVLRNPKFAPDAANMTLFGPGVKAATKAKVPNEISVELSIKLFEIRSYKRFKLPLLIIKKEGFGQVACLARP